MKIKGTSVLSTLNFVNAKFPGQTTKWINSLPESSQKIFTSPIISGQWFSFMDGMIHPTNKIGEVFYGGDLKKAAYEIGKYSADQGLKGAYKVFVRVASTNYVLRKSSQIFNTYYDGASIEIIEQTDNSAVFKVKGVNPEGRIFFTRLSGWMERTIEIVNGKPITVSHTETLDQFNNPEAIITAKWE